MAICKRCKKLVKDNDLIAKYCKDCNTNEKTEDQKIEEYLFDKENEIGFAWWTTWGWLGLTFGNLYLISIFSSYDKIGIGMFFINTFLMIAVLNYNKYAFLVATIISLNPLLWIINAIYLKNRWQHIKLKPDIEKRKYYQEHVNSMKSNSDENIDLIASFTPLHKTENNNEKIDLNTSLTPLNKTKINMNEKTQQVPFDSYFNLEPRETIEEAEQNIKKNEKFIKYSKDNIQYEKNEKKKAQFLIFIGLLGTLLTYTNHMSYIVVTICIIVIGVGFSWQTSCDNRIEEIFNTIDSSNDLIRYDKEVIERNKLLI